MPHCTEGLYCNVLLENWSLEELSNTVIFGNSFEAYQYKRLGRNKSLIDMSLPLLREFPLPCDHDEDLQLCFNDSSLHVFDRLLLEKKDLSFWDSEQLKESYHEEIIRDQLQHCEFHSI